MDNFVQPTNNGSQVSDAQIPASQPIMQPVVEPVMPPVAEPVLQPVAEPMPQPVAEPIMQPVVEPVAQPIEQPVVQPIVEPVAEPIVEPTFEPTTEPIADYTVDHSVEESIEAKTDEPEMSDEEVREALEGMSTDEVLAIFANGLLEEKGFTDIDDDTRTAMIEDLVQRENFMVNQALFNALPEEQKAKIDEIAGKENPDVAEVEAVIAESGIDADAIASNALEDFRKLYLAIDEENLEA